MESNIECFTILIVDKSQQTKPRTFYDEETGAKFGPRIPWCVSEFQPATAEKCRILQSYSWWFFSAVPGCRPTEVFPHQDKCDNLFSTWNLHSPDPVCILNEHGKAQLLPQFSLHSQISCQASSG